MDWIDIVGDIFKFLAFFMIGVLVFLFVMFTVGTMVDTNQKVTKIYETVVPQDTAAIETAAIVERDEYKN